MKNIQIIGLILVVVGSFLPLVHVPIIGNWNYWQLDNRMTMVCWLFLATALAGIATNKQALVRVSAIGLIVLFVLTIIAVKYQSLNYFNFLIVKELRELAAGMVKLKYGWFLEFAGALLLLFTKNKKIN